MKFIAWQSLALSSLGLLAAASAEASTRPRYGGTLRVEMRGAPAALDPSDSDAAPLTSPIFEPLVRLDETGTPQPCLARI